MNRTSQWLMVATLALIAAVGAVLAVHYYSELESLRQAAKGNDDRAELQKKLWDSEKRRRELEAELASIKDRPAATDTAGPKPKNRGDTSGQQSMAEKLAVFAQIRDNPDFQKSMAIQARARLDGAYGALFKSLGLSPEQLAKFKDLLAEKQLAAADVMSAAISQGLDPRDPASRDDIAAMLSSANNDVDDSIRQALGDQKYADYKGFEATIPERNAVNQLAQRLSYTNTPLQDFQSDALVKILSANPSPKDGRNNRSPNGIGTVLNPNRTADVTPDAVNQASSVLTPPQLDALAQLEREQDSQKDLNHIVNEAVKNQPGMLSPLPPVNRATVAPVVVPPPTH
jgi:hypothetical protein